MAESVARNSHACRILAENEGIALGDIRSDEGSPIHWQQRRLTRAWPMGGRKQTASGAAPRCNNCNIIQPAPHSARLPSPSGTVAVSPAAGVIWGPSPRVWRYPGVAPARIVCPGAIGKRIPGDACEVGSPHGAAATRVHETPVVPHVAQAIRIR